MVLNERLNGIGTGKTLQIIGDLRRADAQSKGFGNASANDAEILKELVFRILH